MSVTAGKSDPGAHARTVRTTRAARPSTAEAPASARSSLLRGPWLHPFFSGRRPSLLAHPRARKTPAPSQVFHRDQQGQQHETGGAEQRRADRRPEFLSAVGERVVV